MKFTAAMVAAGLIAGSAQGATLNFGGTACEGGARCKNGLAIDQSFGDMSGVDVQYDADTSTAALDDMVFRRRGFTGLRGVAHSPTDTGSSITFHAQDGHRVVVRRLFVAAFGDEMTDMQVTVTDLRNDAVLFSANEPPLTPDTATRYQGRWVSRTGLRITFGSDMFAGGVDRIRYFTRDITGNARGAGAGTTPQPVPVPASGLLLLGALGLIVAGKGRR